MLREKGNGTKWRDTDSRDGGRRFSRLVRRCLACTQVYIPRGAWGAQDFVFEQNNTSYSSVVVDKDKLVRIVGPEACIFPFLPCSVGSKSPTISLWKTPIGVLGMPLVSSQVAEHA